MSKKIQQVYKDQILTSVNRNELLNNIITDLRVGVGSPLAVGKKYNITKEAARQLMDEAYAELVSFRLENTEHVRALELERNEEVRELIFKRMQVEEKNDTLSNSAFTNLINLVLKNAEQKAKLLALYTVKAEFTHIIKDQYTVSQAADYAAVLAKYGKLDALQLPDIEIYEAQVQELVAAENQEVEIVNADYDELPMQEIE